MADLFGKKILVAGGTGFIGRHLVTKLIEEGASVSVITRKKMESTDKVKYYCADLCNRDSLSQVG